MFDIEKEEMMEEVPDLEQATERGEFVCVKRWTK